MMSNVKKYKFYMLSGMILAIAISYNLNLFSFAFILLFITILMYFID